MVGEPPERFESTDAERVVPQFWTGLGVATMALSVGVMLAGIASGVLELTVLAAMPLLLGFVSTLVGLSRAPHGGAVPCRLVAGADGLEIDGKRIPRAHLTGGVVVPRRHERPVVRLTRRLRARPIEIVVPDVAEGRALLRALGLSATQSVATFSLPSRLYADRRLAALAMAPIGAALFLQVLALLLDLDGLTFVCSLAMAFGYLWVYVAMFWRTRVSVGADGVMVSWLGRRRFLPYADIATVDMNESRYVWGSRRTRVQIHLSAGKMLALPVGSHGEEVLERITEAQSSFRGDDTVADATRLCRGGRAASDWLRELLGIAAGAAVDHRTAPIPEDRLWRIVEHAGALAEARAGAAVALAAHADDAARARLRAVAGAVVSPKLRIAMETAAGGASGERLGAALAELEAIEDKAAAVRPGSMAVAREAGAGSRPDGTSPGGRRRE